MALATSTPASTGVAMSHSLDHEIAQVRNEIHKLTQKRKLLTSSLLSSTKVQSQLSGNLPATTADPQTDCTMPLDLANVQQHSQSKSHRLAFGVTSFPFDDPSPEIQSKNPLLGIRIDVCDRRGQYESPYYVFCIRAGETGSDLRVHRHTIPPLVPLQQYEENYLPISLGREEDEDHGGSNDSRLNNDPDVVEGSRKQDLHGFVARVREDLVNWRLRQAAADWLRDELGLPKPRKPKSMNGSSAATEDQDQRKLNRPQSVTGSISNDDDASDSASNSDSENDDGLPEGKFNITSLQTLEVDARQLHILWRDDNVGRVKISDDGTVKKAIVIGEGGARLRDAERVLKGDGDVGIRDLLGRLERVHQIMMRVEQNEREAVEDKK